MKLSKTSPSKLLLIIISILLVVALSFLLIYRKLINNNSASISDSSNPVNVANYNPPTDAEKASGDQQKQIISDSVTQNNLSDTAKVVIVDSSQYENQIEVRAFVSNVIADGKCIVTFENKGKTLVKETLAYADASTSVCTNITVPRSEFSNSGIWQVIVRYISPKVTGQTLSTVEVK